MKTIIIGVVGLVVGLAAVGLTAEVKNLEMANVPPEVQETVQTRNALPTLRYTYPRSDFYSSEWCQDGIRSILVRPGGGKALNCARATGAEIPISGPLELKN